VEVWCTSNLRPLRIGEEKKDKKKKEETTAAEYNGLPYWAAMKSSLVFCISPAIITALQEPRQQLASFSG